MRLTAFVLTLLLLSGCGWQLRGVTPLPAEYRVLYLQNNASPTFERQLKLQLQFNNVVLTDTLADAQALLDIHSLEIERRTLSVSSTGQVAEYELNALLQARLKRNDRDGEVLIEVTARRYLANDINNVMGTENSERLQRLDMEKDLANKLLRRLQKLDYDTTSIAPELETNAAGAKQ